MAESTVAGFALGMTLIIAIGAQNAFVLRQGLRREHVMAVVLTCALSDAVLITAGVFGFGALIAAMPGLETGMRLLGAGFLLWYGWGCMTRAWAGGEALLAGDGARTLRSALTTCLAFTWLNPHVYLDTLVILGPISTQYADKSSFAAGAIAASFVFFFSLGYGAQALAPFFARPSSWRVLEGIVGTLMWAIALELLL